MAIYCGLTLIVLAILDNPKLHALTNITRLGVFLSLGILIILQRVDPIFIIFGVSDALFALFALLSFITLIKKN